MSIIDRTISAISPGWAYKRLQLRLQRRLLNDAARAYYDAGGNGRRTNSFNSSNAGPNAVFSSGDPMRVRNRAHDAIRTSPHAANGTRKLANKIVGAGITPRFITENARARKMLVKRWKEFTKSVDPTGLTDFYGMQNLLARTVVTGGEGLVAWQWNTKAPYLTATLLEGDFLDSAKTDWRADLNGNRIIHGVELDSKGRRTGYWLFDEHPGEYFGISNGYMSKRLEAKYVDHVFDILRPGQVRGVSWFAPVLLKIRDLADYDDAELVRKRIEACFSAFVTLNAGGSGGPLLGGTDKDGKNRPIEELAPGLIKRLAPGEDVTFAQPTSNDGYLDFLKAQLHAIAAGLGMTYEQLTGDLEGVNYSSIRAGMIDFWEMLDHWQCNMMIHQFCVPAERRFLQMLELTGERIPADLEVEWCPPVRAYVDPEKDIRAIKEELRAGVTTVSRVAASRGMDGAQLHEEVAREQKARRDDGVITDIDIANIKAVPAQPQDAQSQK